MRLSELSPEAVRLVLRLVVAAKGRMNQRSSDEVEEVEKVMVHNSPESSDEPAFDLSELSGKTPKYFPKSNDW